MLKTDDDRHAILVGGGTGLAPLKSMVRYALEDGAYERRTSPSTKAPGHASGSMTSSSSASLASAVPRPVHLPAVPVGGDRRRLRGDPTAYGFGMVTDVIAADHPTCGSCAGYLCGPPPMVEAALKTLMCKRLFPRDIHREDFFNEGDKATGGVRSPLIKR